MKRGVVVAVCLILANGSVWSQQKTDPTLTKQAEAFAAAFNAKDAAKVASFYTDDAALMPPNEPMVSGRKNIQAWFQKAIDQGLTDMRLMPRESATAGTQAFEAGTYSLTVKGGSGAPMTDKGKYMVVMKRVSNDWKIAHDIFNSDLPPPPAPK